MCNTCHYSYITFVGFLYQIDVDSLKFTLMLYMAQALGKYSKVLF